MSNFDWRAYPRNVNLGCGWDRREGYLNIDMHAFHNPDLMADVRDCHELPSGEYDEVLAQDILEHLPRADAPVALREWARLLRIGGRLTLRVPDLIGLLGLFTERSTPAEHAELVQCLYGTQAYDGDWHSNGFTELLLRHALHDAGFDVVSVGHRDVWLFDVVAVRTDSPSPVAEIAPAPRASRADVDDLRSLTDQLAASRLQMNSINTTSRLPGGSLAHRIVGRLNGRQASELARQTNEALELVTAALARVAAIFDSSAGERPCR